MSADGHHAGLAYHVDLLSDPWRMTTWKRAIFAAIRPGDVVLDVGTGTGILAVWAAQAGASRVLAVESSAEAAIAVDLVERSGVSDVVEVVQSDLATLAPQGVDVILCDFVGRLIPDGTMVRALRAARAWAGPQTRWLPERVELQLAVLGDVEVPGIERWEHPLLGLDLRGGLERALGTPWSGTFGPEALLGPARTVATLSPERLEDTTTLSAELECRAGISRGALAWFTSHFGPGLLLDTGPGRRTFWGQVVWGMPRQKVFETTRLQVEATLRSEPTGVSHQWSLHADPAEPAPPVDPRSRPRLALPDLLLDGVPQRREALAAAITALYHTGDPAMRPLLAAYERRFGPHPVLRRSP